MHRYVDLLSEKASNPTIRQGLRSLALSQHVDDPINIQFTSGTTGLPKVLSLFATYTLVCPGEHSRIVRVARYDIRAQHCHTSTSSTMATSPASGWV
jgi:acyl-coenzyme A synthetase/AMP-(fatty) acid ligase